MAQFKGYLSADGKDSITRLGHKSGGLTLRANGWNSGVVIRAFHNGKDVFVIEQTGGSNGGFIRTLAIVEDGELVSNVGGISNV